MSSLRSTIMCILCPFPGLLVTDNPLPFLSPASFLSTLLFSMFLAWFANADEGRCPNTPGERVDAIRIADILAKHEDWLQDHSHGAQAHFCNLDLREVDLSNAKLFQSDFRLADLQAAKLADAQFGGSNFTGADMSDIRAMGAQFDQSDLIDVNLDRATLNGAEFYHSHLRPKSAVGAQLVEATLYAADLADGDFTQANFTDAILIQANGTRGRFMSATLCGANLRNTRLGGADLTGARLGNAKIIGTELSGTRLTYADFSPTRCMMTCNDCTFEPYTVPDSGFLGGILGLDTIRFSPDQSGGIVLLRAQLRAAGLRDSERDVTYVIENTSAQAAPVLERFGRWLLFDLPTAYGRQPGRALFGILILFVMGSVVYMIPLIGKTQARLRRLSPLHLSPLYECRQGYTIVTGDQCLQDLVVQSVYKALLHSAYFSLLSILHIGWRDFHLGDWIRRMQPSDYLLQGTRWVRVASGFQALASLYLLVMFFLTYFGRPFG